MNTQVPKFVSWKPVPEAWETDAMKLPWDQLQAYASPPFCLIGRALTKVHQDQATLILVTPTWQTSPWYKELLEMITEDPAWARPTDVANKTSSSPVKSGPETSRMENIRQHSAAEGISKGAQNLLCNTWKNSTKSANEIPWCKCWAGVIETRGIQLRALWTGFLGEMFALGPRIRYIKCVQVSFVSLPSHHWWRQSG